MKYKEVLSYLFSRLPMYQRIGKAAYKADLNNTLELDAILNHPHKNFRSIHVAGTNGKGSVSHFLASILMEAGYKTGLYTSPHLLDFRERIQIQGKAISKKQVIQFTKKIKPAIERINPSFFEITVAMAFDFFANEHADIALIETGLGGRLDSTNIITPVLSVITNISMEHEDLLGDTIEKIAAEKAGIIKNNVAVIIGKMQKEIVHVFRSSAERNNAAIEFADQNYHVKRSQLLKNGALFEVTDKRNAHRQSVLCDQKASYQSENLATVFQAVELLRSSGLAISDKAVRKGLSKVRKNTSLRGRWEQLATKPPRYCDIAHNPGAIRSMLEQLAFYKYDKLHIVLGFSSDKNFEAILPQFPQTARYYFCKPSVERGLEAEKLQQMTANYQLFGNYFPSVESAIRAAQEHVAKKDFILITGSAFVVADALAFYKIRSKRKTNVKE